MDTYTVGDTVSELFTLESRATGQSFTRVASYINGSASTFNPSSVSEIGGGSYRWVYTPVITGLFSWVGDGTAGDRITVTFRILPAAADPAAIADALAAVQSDVTTVKAMTDVATSTRATPGAYVAAGGTVATNGDITIRRGNAYLATDGLALPWSSSSWPVLTSATITLHAESAYDDRVTFSAPGTVVTATGTTKAVRVELSEAQTTALTAGDWLYVVRAVLSNGNDVDLATGALTVLDPLGG